jgi:ComF family protein
MTESFSGFKDLMIRMANALKAVLFPAKCLACRSFFNPEAKQGGRLFENCFQDEPLSVSSKKAVFEGLMAPFLCTTCSANFLPVESPFCSSCGIMFKSREGEDHFCGECLGSPKRFNIARAPGIYDHALLEAIHLLKYRGKIQLARPLGMLLFFSFIALWDEKSTDVVIPVPLHVKRLKKRGFNQALLLVKDWGFYAKTFGIELSHMHVERHLLVRNRWTEPQTGLNRKKRKANIKNAFRIRDAEKLNGKRVLLVDDVYTTGATADECAKVLLGAGARQVDVLTLARAM